MHQTLEQVQATPGKAHAARSHMAPQQRAARMLALLQQRDERRTAAVQCLVSIERAKAVDGPAKARQLLNQLLKPCHANTQTFN